MRTDRTRRLLAAVVCSVPLVAMGASEKSPAGIGTGELSSLFLGLLFVLAVIVGCAWLIKRMGAVSGANTGTIKVLAVSSVGSRERIALVEVGGQQLLLGVTQQQINTLHTFAEPVVSEPDREINSEFAQKLHQLMSRK